MKFEKKSIFLGIGGLAALGGAAYYLYQKKINTPPSDLMEKIEWYSQRFWETPIKKLSKMESSFKIMLDQVLELQLRSMQQAPSEVDYSNTQRKCRKLVKNSYFYECLDCSPKGTLPLKKSGGEINLHSYVHTICEDCFDQEIHKGHRYKLVPSLHDNECDCGCDLLFKEQSFCKKHTGYKKLKQEYTKNDYNEGEGEVRQKCIKIFKQLFYSLVDGFSENYYKVTRTLKKDQKIGVNEITIHFNVYLKIVFNLINQILPNHNELIYLFIDLFQQTFDQPLRIDVSKDDKIEMLNNKRVDTKETIYGYLVRLLFFQSKQNELSFSTLVNEMALADKEFSLEISTHFIQNFKYYLLIDQITIYNQAYEYKYLSKASNPILTNICLKDYPLRLISDHLDCVYKLLLFYGEYTKSLIPEFVLHESSIPFTIEQILLGLIQGEKTLKNHEFVKVVIECLMTYQVSYFANLSLQLDEKIDSLIKYIAYLERNLHYFVLQTFFCQVIQLLIVDVKKSNDPVAMELIFETITSHFEAMVDKQYKEIVQFESVSNQHFLHYGIISMQLFSYIGVLSSESLTQQTLEEGIIKSFKFTTRDQLVALAEKMYFICSKYITHNQTLHGLLPLKAENFFNSDRIYQSLSEIQCQATAFSEFSLYDYSTFSMQILILLEPESTGKKLVSDVINLICDNEHHNQQLLRMRIIKHTKQLFQLMFDQTPFINLIYPNQVLLPQIQQRDKQLLSTSVQRVLSQLYQYFYSNLIEKQMFGDSIKHVLMFDVQEELQKISKFNQNTQLTELKEEYVFQKDFSNLSRFGLDLRNKNDELIQSSYKVVCRKDIFEDLFSYQITVIIELVAQPETFRQLLAKMEKKQFIIAHYRLFIYFIFLLNEKLENKSLDFTASQQQRVEECIQILTSNTDFGRILSENQKIYEGSEERVLADSKDMLDSLREKRLLLENI